jgi:hypothetical protein
VDYRRNLSQESEARLSQDLPPGEPVSMNSWSRGPRLVGNVRGLNRMVMPLEGGEPHTMHNEDEGNRPRKDGR